LLLLNDVFRRALSTCRVLIIIGYRFADEPIRTAVLDALSTNSELTVLILCGDRASSGEARSLLLQNQRHHARRVQIFEPGYIQHALRDNALFNHVARLLTNNQASTPPRLRTNEVICQGDFSSIALHGTELVLGAGNGQTELLRCQLASGELRAIDKWRGWARGVSVYRDDALVADCRRGGFKAGWGLLWKVDLKTGARRSRAWSCNGCKATARLSNRRDHGACTKNIKTC
jgi:hypothetical protein